MSSFTFRWFIFVKLSALDYGLGLWPKYVHWVEPFRIEQWLRWPRNIPPFMKSGTPLTICKGPYAFTCTKTVESHQPNGPCLLITFLSLLSTIPWNEEWQLLEWLMACVIQSKQAAKRVACTEEQVTVMSLWGLGQHPGLCSKGLRKAGEKAQDSPHWYVPAGLLELTARHTFY